MGLKDKTVQVPEGVDEFGEKLASFVKAVDKALEDGWQATQDLPVIISAAISDLVPALNKIKAAGDDLKAYPYASAKSIAVNVADMVEAIATKG